MLPLSHLMSQLISSYVFRMILAKLIELRTHLLIFLITPSIITKGSWNGGMALAPTV